MKINNHSSIKTVLLLSTLLLTNTVIADAEEEKEDKNTRNPLGCRDLGYEFDLKALRLFPDKVGARQSMYFMLNLRNQAVNLYQMRSTDSSRSMYFNHTINAGQWAVLSTTEKKMKYICTISEAGSRYGKIVDCSESLKVCEFDNVKYGLNNRGNYWLVNSNTKSGALHEVVRYGIIPAM